MRDRITKLAQARRAKHLKQYQLAELAGVSSSTLCIHEKKGITSKKMAEKFAEILQCSPKDLIEL